MRNVLPVWKWHRHIVFWLGEAVEMITSAAAFDACAAFLRSIGIEVEVCPGVTGFLEHVRIDSGRILVDPLDDAVCGTMLHEAGHIAVTPSLFRPAMTDDAGSVWPLMTAYLEAHPEAFGGVEEDPIARAIMQSDESEAIAWSYAAAVAIGVDTALPFLLGFDSDGMAIKEMLAMGCHFGIHGLAAGGMTKTRGPDGFPKMIMWTQI